MNLSASQQSFLWYCFVDFNEQLIVLKTLFVGVMLYIFNVLKSIMKPLLAIKYNLFL